MMDIVPLLGVILMSLFIDNAVRADPCHFEPEWRGQWYQSGLGDITIGHNSITWKGVCRDRHMDYYLLENQELHCHKCVLLLPRHQNIIQYKESYCVGRDSLQNICAQIRVEAVMYTLVRVLSYPVPCPIRNAFYVTYNNNSGGFCRNPTSYVHQCASTALFHFRFHKCQYSAHSYERELDFRCLATWKDGSDMYLYGLFTGADLVHKDDIYRCFIYTILGTVVYMSMSADPTCRGLRSSKDGPMVMELTQDVYGWPESQCRYPRWLVDRDWRDLSGRHHYTVEPDSTVITTSYRSQDNITILQSSYDCISSTPLNQSQHEDFIVLVHVLDHCQAKFRCIRLRQAYSDMVEIHMGDYISDKKSTCSESNFRSSTVRMLIPDDLRSMECPYHGRFVSIPDEDNCQMELRSACDVPYSLDIMSSCRTKPVLQLECLGWWDIRNKYILLAEDTNTGVVNCLSLVERGGQLTLGTESTCNLGVTRVLLQRVTFSFRAYPEPCTTLAPSPAIRGVKHISQSQDDDPGGGYSLMDHPTPPTTKSDFIHQTPNYKQWSSASARTQCDNSSRTLFMIIFVYMSLSR